MIAALYVDVKRGPYAAMKDVDAWGIERNAQLYEGPHPVVAHPPCGPWGALASFCTLQDPTCAPRAVEQVRKWGGVLEHPAHSKIWRHCGLPVPGGFQFGDGFAIRVYQCCWGHKAAKATDLYIVGCEPRDLPPIPPWQEPTHRATGRDSAARRRPGRPDLPGLPKSQRHLTPPAFAEWLVEVANLCR